MQKVGGKCYKTTLYSDFRHLKTLDHPPLLDFYRNSTDEGGPSAHRPSMLQLLHGEKANEVDDFEKHNQDLVYQQLESESHLLSDSSPQKQPYSGSTSEEKKRKTKKKDEKKEKEVSVPLIESNLPTKTVTPRKKFGWIEGVFFR